jgi:hypothetical protein
MFFWSSQKNAGLRSYQNMGERSGRRLSLLRKTCFGPQWEAKKKISQQVSLFWELKATIFRNYYNKKWY